jgi:hypothetical protein
VYPPLIDYRNTITTHWQTPTLSLHPAQLYISDTKHTLGPELLGIALGWERTLGLELDGAHPEAAG